MHPTTVKKTKPQPLRFVRALFYSIFAHMIYSCKLNRVAFYAYHGLYAEEQILGATFYVSIAVSKYAADTINYSSLEQLYNYEHLFAIAQKHMKQTQPLIETIAKNIFDEVLKTMQADEIMVELIKPNPAGLFGSGEAVIILRK